MHLCSGTLSLRHDCKLLSLSLTSFSQIHVTHTTKHAPAAVCMRAYTTSVWTMCIASVLLPFLMCMLAMQFSLDVKAHKHKTDADKRASEQHLREFTLNMATGTASQRVVADVVGDFPSIPRHLVGKILLWPQPDLQTASFGLPDLQQLAIVMCQHHHQTLYCKAVRISSFPFALSPVWC